MSEFSYIQNNMTTGQVSPRLRRRSDIKGYKNGLKTLENMTIMPQGGVKSRPGTIYVSGVKDHSKAVRLEKFQFSTTDNYLLEIGNQYIRFYKNNAQIKEAADTITNITQANPAVVTAGTHGLSNGDQVYITGVVGMTEINNSTQYYKVANATATTFEVQDQDGNNVDSTSFTAYSSAGSVEKIYTLTSPYLEADLFELQFTQSADQMWIVHPSYAPRVLTRTADTSWTLTSQMKDGDSTGATLQYVDGPYLPENTSATTMDPSGTGTSVTIDASTTASVNDGDGFVANDVGRLLRWHDGTNYFYYEITARNSSTQVAATRKSSGTPGGHAASTQWSLGAWSETTGFPAATAFYQGRQAYAGTTEQPDTVWLSKTDDFTNFTPGTNDDDPINVTFASNEVNAIIWLSSLKELRVGTIGGEHILQSASATSALTPTSVEQFQETAHGSKLRVRPLQVDNSTVFVQRTGKKLRQLGYDFSVDAFRAGDLTILNEDITKDGIKQLAYQKEPDRIIWAVRTDGKLIGLTFLPEQEVSGWHLHSLGGSSVEVESVATVPISSQDQVWVAVKRTINGSTRRYIERFSNEFVRVDLEDAVFMDSAIEVTPTTPAATLTPGATSGTGVTFTASAGVFASGDVGKIIKGNSGVALITSFTSTTSVDADITTNFADTSAIASGSWTISTSSVTGLDHLEGQSLSILADGGTHPNETVSSGAITLDYTATDIQVGLGYTQKLETLDLDFGSAKGSAYGNRARINKVVFEFYESMGGKYGRDSTSTTEIVFRQGNNPLGTAVPLYTGTKSERFKPGWADTNKVYFEQTDPLPITITGLTIVGEVSDSS